MVSKILKCEICGIGMKTRVNGSHLKRIHGLTLRDYITKFPTAEIGFQKPKIISYDCRICGNGIKGSVSLSKHLKALHNTEIPNYYISYYLKGSVPLCKCGCGHITTFQNMECGFCDYIIHHSPVWNKGLRLETDSRLKGMYLRPRWNANLTKETDERVRNTAGAIKNSWNPINLRQRSNSYKKSMLEKYGVQNGFQLESVKEKSKRTCMKKYGAENPQFCNDIKFKWKTYTFPNGKTVKYQGYENFALDLLSNTYSSEEIITDRTLIPKIKYVDFDGKFRKYCPDIWIPKANLLIEAKSNYTYNLHKQNIHHKKIGVISCRYNFRLFVFNDDGTLNNTINE